MTRTVMPEIVLAAVDRFDFAAEDYRALFERAQVSPFQHPDWLSAFYRILAPAHGAEPLIVVGRRLDDGALALVVPLLRRRTASGIVIEYASLGVTDYALPVIAPEVALAQDGRLAPDYVQALGRFDRLEIAPVREDDVAVWRLLLPLESAPLGFSAHHLDALSQFEVTPELARKVRRLQERGDLALEIVGAESVPDALMAARRFRQGRFRDDPLQSAAGLDFYAAVAATGQASGLARTYRLTCGGETVAVLFGLAHRRRFHYLVLGCDYASFGRFSPGMIMFARAMEDWFGNGGEVFDFTIGDEPFKTALGCARTPMHGFVQASNAAPRVEPALAGRGDA
jgi:CelD/BcsL family acetyltransferase involved in cellulose biosynthesis